MTVAELADGRRVAIAVLLDRSCILLAALRDAGEIGAPQLRHGRAIANAFLAHLGGVWRSMNCFGAYAQGLDQAERLR